MGGSQNDSCCFKVTLEGPSTLGLSRGSRREYKQLSML